MNKKGISLVALVITIIVLIILTGAVIMTGLNAPSNASTAVKNYNTSVLQDAVTIYIMNKMSENNVSVAAGTYTVSTAVAELISGTEWKANAATNLGVSADVLKVNTLSNAGLVSQGTATIEGEEEEEETNP